MREDFVAISAQYEAFRESWRPTQEKVDLAVKTAVEIANPSRVFVFGSWARGEAGIDSDLDLAVFLPDARKQAGGAIEDRLLEVLDDLPMSIDLVVAFESTVKDFSASVNSIFCRILREGKLVYEQPSKGHENKGRNAAA
jgi:predicted nucleotidyltransferase